MIALWLHFHAAPELEGALNIQFILSQVEIEMFQVEGSSLRELSGHYRVSSVSQFMVLQTKKDWDQLV